MFPTQSRGSVSAKIIFKGFKNSEETYPTLGLSLHKLIALPLGFISFKFHFALRRCNSVVDKLVELAKYMNIQVWTN